MDSSIVKDNPQKNVVPFDPGVEIAVVLDEPQSLESVHGTAHTRAHRPGLLDTRSACFNHARRDNRQA
jgi:hypothetical protein